MPLKIFMQSLKTDASRYQSKSVLGKVFLFFFSYEFQVVLMYRLSRLFYQQKLILLARIFRYLQNIKYGTDIHYEAQIGPGLRIKHGMGIVIGSGVSIGSHATIFDHVSLGTKGVLDTSYPKVGDHLFMGTGSKVLGNIIIGDCVIIGANSVLIKDIASNQVVAGNPARIIKSHQIDYSDI